LDGVILTHVHDEQDWRLRRFRAKRDNHPVDPNWETGRYIWCHADARDKIEPGLVIFDVVYLHGEGVVRSAFEVTKKITHKLGPTLYFKRFWYPSSSAESVTALAKFHQTRYPKKLGENEVESLIGDMKRAGYREYECGQVPSDVNINDWNSMIKEARSSLGDSHICP
jgi:hypothetical protein